MIGKIIYGLVALVLLVCVLGCGKIPTAKEIKAELLAERQQLQKIGIIKPKPLNEEQRHMKLNIVALLPSGMLAEEVVPMLEPEDFAFAFLVEAISDEERILDEESDLNILKMNGEQRSEEAKKIALMLNKIIQLQHKYLIECQRILRQYLIDHNRNDHQWVYWQLGQCFFLQQDYKGAKIYFNKGLDYHHSRLLCLESLLHLTVKDDTLSPQQAMNDISFYNKQMVEIMPDPLSGLYNRAKRFKNCKSIKDAEHFFPTSDPVDYINIIIPEEWEREQEKQTNILIQEANAIRHEAEEYVISGKEGASDLINKALNMYEQIAWDMPYGRRINFLGLLPFDAESENYNENDVFTPLGDIYRRYAEVFQKEVNAGLKSEMYTAIVKKAKDDAELKEIVKNHLIESYQTAVFNYWLAPYYVKFHIMEQNSRKIAEIRNKIRELEGRPEPQKDTQSPLK